VGSTLMRGGHQVYVAASGREGLDLARQVETDLFLLDVVMPGLDGFETCRRTRQLPGHRQVPVIVLTGRSEQSDVVRGLESGASDYLGKPIQVSELLARVETQARLGRLTRKLEQEVSLRTAELQDANQQLQELAVQTTLAVERDRQRLAQGLHDDVIQNLALVRKQLANSAVPTSGEGPDPLRTIDKSVEQLRSLIFELSPRYCTSWNWVRRWMPRQSNPAPHAITAPH
jgi:DNA-binding response OmpR family regulator